MSYEAFTSGRVSATARERYIQRMNYSTEEADRMFKREGSQWVMYVWESQIERARALGGTQEDNRLREKADKERGYKFQW